MPDRRYSHLTLPIFSNHGVSNREGYIETETRIAGEDSNKRFCRGCDLKNGVPRLRTIVYSRFANMQLSYFLVEASSIISIFLMAG